MSRRVEVGHEPRPAHPDDAELLASLATGDPEAVAVLYDRHAGPLYRLAACLVGPAAAEAVVCDVLVRACCDPGVLSTTGNSLRTELLVRTARRCRGSAGAS